MKKQTGLFFAGLVGWLILGGGLPVAAAATTTTTADFELQGGDLKLAAVPDLNFGSAEVAGLINQGLTLTSPAGQDSDQKIQVVDERGINSGWQLTAELGAFNHVTVADKALPATAIKLIGGEVTGDNVEAMKLDDANFAGAAAGILQAGPERGTGVTTVTFDWASLDLPRTTNARAGAYQADITWQLAAVPTPTAED